MPLDNYNPGPVFDLILRLKAQTNSGKLVVTHTLSLLASNKICLDNDDGLLPFNDDDIDSQLASFVAYRYICSS